MLINLTDNFKSAGKISTIKPSLEKTEVELDTTSYKVVDADGIELTIKNIGQGHLTVSLNGKVKLLMQCNRCLEDVEQYVDLDFLAEVIEPDGFNEIDEEQELFMDGYELDAEALIHNELIMGLPMKVLCKDDCKGLCPVCGSNRNKGECDCDTFVPDPRMAAIQDIFNAYNKEV